jgi:hypothetical protein
LTFHNIPNRILQIHGIIDPFRAAMDRPPLCRRLFRRLVQVPRTPRFELAHDLIGVNIRGHHNMNVIGSRADRVKIPAPKPAMIADGQLDDGSVGFAQFDGFLRQELTRMFFERSLPSRIPSVLCLTQPSSSPGNQLP